MPVIVRYPDIDPTPLHWHIRSYFDVWTELLERAPEGRPLVIGIDGHSGCGKTTLANGLAAIEPHTAVIHTDDVAWHHSFFDWGELMVEHLLKPLHQGRIPISYRPPGWVRRNRPGAITVAADTTVVLVEGVGVARRETRSWLDVVTWVYAPNTAGRRRLVTRGDSDAFIEEWMTQENGLLAEHRPWEVADLLVAGELGQPSHNGRYGNVVTAPGPRQTRVRATDEPSDQRTTS
jgi:energy-coupling factor transporter ATP-binding protein EcfA2